MSLTLYLDRLDWFQHMEQMEKLYPGCVPVIKGTGYGFGNEVLADAARKFGKREIAVGTVEEARQLQATHPLEQVIVLTPVMSELRKPTWFQNGCTLWGVGIICNFSSLPSMDCSPVEKEWRSPFD